jgi:hypothetical protein
MVAYGDAQNIFIRAILCKVSSKIDARINNAVRGADFFESWKTFCLEKEYNTAICPYSGCILDEKSFDGDHLVPHNKDHGGLHTFGNVIPCNKKANSVKGRLSYVDFFARLENLQSQEYQALNSIEGSNMQKESIEKRKKLVDDYIEKEGGVVSLEKHTNLLNIFYSSLASVMDEKVEILMSQIDPNYRNRPTPPGVGPTIDEGEGNPPLQELPLLDTPNLGGRNPINPHPNILQGGVATHVYFCFENNGDVQVRAYPVVGGQTNREFLIFISQIWHYATPELRQALLGLPFSTIDFNGNLYQNQNMIYVLSGTNRAIKNNQAFGHRFDGIKNIVANQPNNLGGSFILA